MQKLTEKSFSLLDWLSVLETILQPSKLLLVGAGDGQGELARYVSNMKSSSARLIEADEEQYAQLSSSSIFSDPRFSFKNTVVYQSQEDVNFYVASYRDESGLIPAEDMNYLWPNLKTLEKKQRNAESLQNLLEEFSAEWLFVDCFPAARLLESASNKLDNVDVVLVRAVVEEKNDVSAASENELNSGLDQISSVLGRFKFRNVMTEFGRHPRIAHVLYVKDISVISKEKNKYQICSGTQAYDSQTSQKERDENSDENSLVVHKSNESRDNNLNLLISRIDSLEEEFKKNSSEVEKIKKNIKNLTDTLARQQNNHQVAKDEIGSAASQIELLKEIFLKNNRN